MSMRSRPSPGVPAAVVLVCDECESALSAAVHLRDWYVLWPVAVGAGWRGEPHPFGVHHCAQCAGPESGAR
ncbi:hypothetical protein [Asanoa hainanensis]|nr:hypothetical protein [Asanoa hainanensis]